MAEFMEVKSINPKLKKSEKTGELQISTLPYNVIGEK